MFEDLLRLSESLLELTTGLLTVGQSRAGDVSGGEFEPRGLSGCSRR